MAAAPLLCAGLTTYNAIMRAGVKPGSTVAVLGIGGLGHLGIQYADKMGMKTVAIARGTEKEPLSRALGADYYVDADNSDEAVRRQQQQWRRAPVHRLAGGLRPPEEVSGPRIS